MNTNCERVSKIDFLKLFWETDFYAPPVLGGAALFDRSAPAVYKFRVLRAQDFYTPLALNCQEGQHLPALEVFQNQSPIFDDFNFFCPVQTRGPKLSLQIFLCVCEGSKSIRVEHNFFVSNFSGALRDIPP